MKVASAMLACCLWSCTEPLPTPDHDCYSDSACEQGQYCNLASLQCEDRDNIDGSFGVDISRGQMTQDTAVTNLSDQQLRSSEDMTPGHDMNGQDSDLGDRDASLIADQLMPNADGALFLDQQIQPDAMQPPPTNLLVDPSFENNDSTWNIYGGATRVQTEQQSGMFSLRLNRRSGAEQRISGLRPNSRYRLSGWGLSNDDEPTLIGVKNHGYAQDTIQFRTRSFSESSMVFTTGFGTTSVTIFAYKHEGGESGFADNLSLTYIGPSNIQPIWADEFDGSGPVDTNRWGFEEGFVRNQEAQWYQSENAFRQDGILIIEARSERRTNPNYDAESDNWRQHREFIDYTSASINTKERFTFQYGRLVVRAKVTNLPGTRPAIWTLGVECEWPSNGEVDVMENYDNTILANFAWGTNRRWQPEWDVVFIHERFI